MPFGSLIAAGVADGVARLSNLRDQRRAAREWNKRQELNKQINSIYDNRQNIIDQSFDWQASAKDTGTQYTELPDPLKDFEEMMEKWERR